MQLRLVCNQMEEITKMAQRKNISETEKDSTDRQPNAPIQADYFVYRRVEY